MVHLKGLEPLWSIRQILDLLRLPISPQVYVIGFQCFDVLADPVRIELTTCRLTVGCSAAELQIRGGGYRIRTDGLLLAKQTLFLLS